MKHCPRSLASSPPSATHCLTPSLKSTLQRCRASTLVEPSSFLVWTIYCSSLCTGLPNSHLASLRSVLQIAAKGILWKPKSESVIPQPQTLPRRPSHAEKVPTTAYSPFMIWPPTNISYFLLSLTLPELQPPWTHPASGLHTCWSIVQPHSSPR